MPLMDGITIVHATVNKGGALPTHYIPWEGIPYGNQRADVKSVRDGSLLYKRFEGHRAVEVPRKVSSSG